jgi:hypothetical protein
MAIERGRRAFGSPGEQRLASRDQPVEGRPGGAERDLDRVSYLAQRVANAPFALVGRMFLTKRNDDIRIVMRGFFAIVIAPPATPLRVMAASAFGATARDLAASNARIGIKALVALRAEHVCS